jgi:hypothetical protein
MIGMPSNANSPNRLSSSAVRTVRSVRRLVDRAGFVPTKTTGKRSICTLHGAKNLFEGMRDRPDLFRSSSDFNKEKYDMSSPT